MNKPYLDKYGQASWVPVFLKDNELTDPATGSSVRKK